MRKLQIVIIYFTLSFMLFYLPKPEILLETETYESRMRKHKQINQKEDISILVAPQTRDTLSYLQSTP